MNRSFYIVLALLVFPSLACQDPVLIQAASLNGPTAIAVASGKVCSDELGGDVAQIAFRPCETNAEGEVVEEGGIGLTVNENSDRLSLFSLRGEPTLINFNQGIPGATHLQVGRLPVDVAASPDGTVAYTLNQIDMDISVVSLWGGVVQSDRIGLPRTPIAFDVRKTTGQLVVAVDAPSTLLMLAGSTCTPDNTCANGSDAPRTLELPGTVTDLVTAPDGSRAYVTYQGLNRVDVVDLETFRVSDTIPVAFECADGLDNDGDGFADRLDPQCYGPFGAESQGGSGRDEMRDCADLQDNDGDGLIDRDDPDCTGGADSEDPKPGDLPTAECNDGLDNDGDGLADYPADPKCYGPFGRTEDAIVERGFAAVSIDALGAFVYAVDRARNQVVVIDATRNKLIDVALSAEPSGKTFSTNVGIGVSPSPLAVQATIRRDCVTEENGTAPCNASFFQFYDKETVVVRYSYDAWVSEDTGRIRAINVMDTYCEAPTAEVKAPTVVQSPNSDVELDLYTTPFRDLEAYLASEEGKCFVVPEFPLQPRDDWQGDCSVSCDGDCDEELLKSRFFCSQGTSILANPRMGLIDVDNSFATTSGKGRCELPTEVSAQLRGFAAEANTPRNFTCTSMLLPQPIELDVLARQSNPETDRNSYASLLEDSRADLIQTTATFLSFNNEVITFGSTTRPFDSRIVSESWNVDYEGVLPGTRRSDGLLAEATTDLNGREVIEFQAGGLDLCRAGVEVGDLLTIATTPTDVEACPQFDSTDESFLTYEIVDRDASTYTLAVARCKKPVENLIAWTGAVDTNWDEPGNWDTGVVPNERDAVYICAGNNTATLQQDTRLAGVVLEAGADIDNAGFTLNAGTPVLDTRFSQELPTRACFQTGTTYEVRPHLEWIVTGSRSGLVSGKESRFGECVPMFGTQEQDDNPASQTPTRASRVKTGEIYYGPYLSFWLFPGPDRLDDDGVPEDDRFAVIPTRGLTFTFDVDSNFFSRSFVTDGNYPSKLGIYELYGYYRILSTDANFNFVFYKSIRNAGEEGSRLR